KQADKAYIDSAKCVKHQKLDQSASFIYLLTLSLAGLIPSARARQFLARVRKSFNSDGLYGKALVTFYRCAVAAESFLENGFGPVAAEAHRTGQKLKSPAELCTVAGNLGNVKCLIKNGVLGRSYRCIS